MWWEILPSFGIITAVMAIPSLAQRAINRAIHEGNPTKRDYTMTEKYAVLYHWRDMQHSRPNVWNKYVKEDLQGKGSVYKCNTLADLQ